MPCLEIYGTDMSAPCRTAMMTCEVAGVEYKVIETMPGPETRTPEFLAMNPTHTIPVIKDGDFVIYESRAIAAYIMNKYCKDEKTNPQDPEGRARIDQRMYYDMGLLYKNFGNIVYPTLFFGIKTGEKEQEELKEALGYLEDYVAGDKFACGNDCLTVADLTLVSTYASIEAAKIVDLSGYKNCNAWYAKCKGLIPNYEKANAEGAVKLGDFYRSKL